MKREIVVFGGAGSGAMVAQSVRRLATAGHPIAVVGFLNDQLPIGTPVGGAKVLGPFNNWHDLPERIGLIAPLHRPKVSQTRIASIARLQIPSMRWTTVIDPSAIVADDVVIGAGSYIAPLAVVDPGATLGRHIGIWPAAQIGHDCIAEDFVFVGRAGIICGRCRIRTGAYVGAGAVVSDGVTLGRYCVIGAGALVVNDVPDHAIVVGRPARITSRLDPSDDPVAI